MNYSSIRVPLGPKADATSRHTASAVSGCLDRGKETLGSKNSRYKT